jgi:hypothetical protein
MDDPEGWMNAQMEAYAAELRQDPGVMEAT